MRRCAKGSKRIPLPQCLYPVTLATPVRNSPKRSSEYRTMKKISIGSWAYVFNQEHVADFHTVLHKLQDLKLDGVELGSFGIHPTPKSHPTKAARAALKKEVADHGLTFSGIAPDLWSFKIISVEDPAPYLSAFLGYCLFASD